MSNLDNFLIDCLESNQSEETAEAIIEYLHHSPIAKKDENTRRIILKLIQVINREYEVWQTDGEGMGGMR